MSWARVGSVQDERANLPAGSLVVRLFHSVEAGDLVVVGIGTDAHQDSFDVRDNSPSGPNAYSRDVIGDNVSSTGTVAIYSCVMYEHIASAAVTIANGDGGSNRIGGVIAGYRVVGTPYADNSDLASGVGTAPGVGPVALPFSDELVVAMILARPQSLATVIAAPLTRKDSLNVGGVYGVDYADEMGDSNPSVSVAATLSSIGDWALGVVTYSIGTPRPPLAKGGGFVSGGIQPGPVYRKQWDRHWIGPQRRRRFSNLLK